MIRFVAIAMVLVAATAARGDGAPSGSGGAWERVHPAVVRVIVPEGGATSLGSGALIAVNERHGLVVTNWHVVRDGRGPIEVVFPGGFRSGATVLKTDRAWDLAALAIWRPDVEPIRLATDVPRPGEPLVIAGYGSGRYRTAAGRCTQYVSPGGRMPFEMIELSASARQGDSGGPILNRRGELAGVLFGTAWGTTTGSHCRRVRRFLGSITDDFNRLSDSPTMIASHPRPRSNPQLHPQPGAAVLQPHVQPQPGAAVLQHYPTVTIPSGGQSDDGWTASAAAWEPSTGDAARAAEPLGWDDVAGPGWAGRIKTILAIIGLFAIVFHALRLLGSR
jgi:hypothetical protein